MKKIILLELSLLFLATTFQSHNPPGWYQQQLPVNDLINDIFFLDSLTGWAVTNGSFANSDTSYILHTSNGGTNWTVQNIKIEQLNAVQFLDANTGYAAGGRNGTVNVSFYKTTNSGNNWTALNNLGGVAIADMYFINADTGWVCDDDPIFGGVWKTSNGGNNWFQQLGVSVRPIALFFLNNDTGWVSSNANQKQIYRTTNGGTNWAVQYTFPGRIADIFFFNQHTGIATAALNHRTTDGGFTWTTSNNGGGKISMGSDSVGWAGRLFSRISKTTDQGITWYLQQSEIFNNSSVYAINSLKAWAGGSGMVHTTDGGGPMSNIQQLSSEIPQDFALHQNYPNPFNSEASIKYEISRYSEVKLIVYDMTGRVIANLVNEIQSPGIYSYTFYGDLLPSGVYFYGLITDGILINTKKMVIVK